MNTKYRKAVIAGNWKMNLLPSQVRDFADALKALQPNRRLCDIVLCPSFVCIPAALKAVKGSHIFVGAQNLNENPAGAYTGEVSAQMLTDLGVSYVILGHSERRQYYGETDASVNRKLAAALAAELRPIVCVGETLTQRDQGVTMEQVRMQVKSAFCGVDGESARRAVIAYEPIWAIGTGRTATPEQAQEVCAGIRGAVRELYGARIARGISVLYGGSMNEKNAAELLSQPDIDGGLIGGASLVPEKFAAIIETANTY
ncbi:MAG: triose-phosphate isomerase [Oscillospiraceae bacterium]|jgi:triosephosphate isomerase|nr:triose-phosphate isomerase [Oscillospiraceae bacterium]MBQ8929373.1 triose-phosphate isomerase [Oscillospiraceae bacterium]MBR6430590.1 triose-phosphate isomerase [Oscillospiraceae bacterium]